MITKQETIDFKATVLVGAINKPDILLVMSADNPDFDCEIGDTLNLTYTVVASYLNEVEKRLEAMSRLGSDNNCENARKSASLIGQVLGLFK